MQQPELEGHHGACKGREEDGRQPVSDDTCPQTIQRPCKWRLSDENNNGNSTRKNLKTALSERRNARLAERAQTDSAAWRVCGELTPPAAVLVGVILEVEFGRVEVSERLALRLRLRVHVQLGEQRDARKPQLQNGAEADELITPISNTLSLLCCSR